RSKRRTRGSPFGCRSGAHCLTRNVTEQVPANDWGGVHRIGSVSLMAGRISMGARREVVSAVAGRYRPAKRAEKGRILDELCATTGWHRKHAVRALRQRETVMPR